MDEIIRIGMDTSKQIFQLHGVDAAEKPVLRRAVKRKDLVAFFTRLPPTEVALEACGASHHWARTLGGLGHKVRLIAPQLVKPYVKRGKNDAADAEALCEAMSRPTMRFVPVKSAENQAALMLAGVRDRLVRNRAQLANAIRGHAAEFGLIAAKGKAAIEPLLKSVAEDERVPALAREMFVLNGREHADLVARIAELDARLLAWHRANALSRGLTRIPSVGPVIASMLVLKVPDPHLFRSGRAFAAWLGLTPKDHSTAGKTRLGKITRAGDESLRSLLVVGATAVIWQVRRAIANRTPGRRPSPWLVDLLARKPPKLAAVALANKVARIAWKMMATGELYDAERMIGAPMRAEAGSPA